MKDLTFIQQLKRELPTWVNKGWVKKENQNHILDYVSQTQESKPDTSSNTSNTITFTLAWMGVILLTGGIVTFFAHTWAIFPKITKLGILFGSLWICFGLSYLFQKRTSNIEFNQRMSELFSFLGLIIFGANIWLISQIYHIDEHYPTGVLLWSLAALSTAYLIRSHVGLIISIILATLWSAMETFDFMRSVHWGFPILWLFFLYPCIEYRWKRTLHFACFCLLAWSFFIIILFVADFFFMQVYFLIGLATFLLGRILTTYKTFKDLGPYFQHYGAAAALLGLFIPTFPFNITKERGLFFDIIPSVGGTETLIAILAVLFAMIWLAKRAKNTFDHTSFIYGQGIFIILCLIMGVNLLLGTHIEHHRAFISITFNVLFLAGLGWIIYSGYQFRDQVLVNLGFVFFALIILSRYVDTFWTYLNRSVFYITGGLILTVGCYYFEKQRRKIAARIEQKAGGRE